MTCNGSHEVFSEAGAGARAPKCCRCGTVIAGPVHVGLLNEAARAQLAAEQRRTEILIGELLGPAEMGRPADGKLPALVTMHHGRRHEFRQMAEHATEAEGLIAEGVVSRPDARREERVREARTKVCGWCRRVFVAAPGGRFLVLGPLPGGRPPGPHGQPVRRALVPSPSDTPSVTVTGDV